MRLVPSSSVGPDLPASIVAAGQRAAYRFVEFFTAQIRNPNTRRAYVKAVRDFCGWLQERGIPSIEAVESIHVATYIEVLGREHAAPTVKLRLAAIRMMFDWLATGGHHSVQSCCSSAWAEIFHQAWEDRRPGI